MQNNTLNSRVTLCEDGKYRWVYEMGLFKNPTIFFLVWEIFFALFVVIFVMICVTDIQWGTATVIYNLKTAIYFLIGMTVVVAIGYAVYAAIMGGKYVVEFEMDENGINHKQTEAQANKAEKIGKATALSGVAAGKLTTIGVGMNAQRTEMYSDFCKVKKVKAYPHRHLIKVNGTLSHNQVYTAKEDFDFVKEYIIMHCPNIK